MKSLEPRLSVWLRAALPAATVSVVAACQETPGTDRKDRELRPAETTSSLNEPIQQPRPGDRTRALALLQQGQASQVATRLKEARQRMEQAVQADPAYLEARRALGFLLLEPGIEQNQGEALRQFRTARLLDPDDTASILGEGIARQELGDAANAEPLLREALGRPLEPPELEGPGRLALARLLAADGRDAGPEFERALLLWPADAAASPRARVLVAAADWHSQNERPGEAEQCLREAVTLDRTHVRAHYQLFRLLARHGDPDEAAHYQRIHEILRQLTDHTSQAFLQDHESRIRLQKELVEAYPEHTRARFDLIRALLEMRKHSDALTELAVQARIGGMTAEVLYLTARAKAGLGDVAGARQAHDQMRRLQPNAPAGVTRDILDEWQKTTGVDAAMYQATLNEWLRGRG